MIRFTNSIKLVGIDGAIVTVECNVIESGVGIHLVGLADAAVKESLLRTVTALQAYGFSFPGSKIVINLAPADLAKSATGYDLPMALTIIAASGQHDLNYLDRFLVIGELGLDGTVREVNCCVQAVEAAIDAGLKGVIIPKTNGVEVARIFANTIPVYPVSNLGEAIDVVSGNDVIPTAWDEYLNGPVKDVANKCAWDKDVLNAAARRALEIAAAGGHHMALMGPPGSGKYAIASALVELLPQLSANEAIDVARVYSAAGLGAYRALQNKAYQRPFRAQIYNMSLTAFAGGGTGETIKPGEASLASKGVLFIEEANKMPKSLSRILEDAMQEKQVTVARLKSKVTFPTDFQFIAGIEPCPCGYYGEGDHCKCTTEQRMEWNSTITSKPWMSKIDMQVWVHPGDVRYNLKPEERESVEVVAERVRLAREMQARRFRGRTDIRLNADMKDADTHLYCPLTDECIELVNRIMERLNLSSDAGLPMLRVARTIADLDGCDMLLPRHIAEAASYRFLDRRA